MTTPRTEVAGKCVPENSARLRILIAEDVADCADSMALLLRLYGHEVEIARSGPAALEKAKAYQPDVLLLDIGLPGMDGYEVANRLKKLNVNKKPVIIAVTGYGQEADRRHSAQSGIDLHLTKPVDPEHLEHLLRGMRAVVS